MEGFTSTNSATIASLQKSEYVKWKSTVYIMIYWKFQRFVQANLQSTGNMKPEEHTYKIGPHTHKIINAL